MQEESATRASASPGRDEFLPTAPSSSKPSPRLRVGPFPGPRFLDGRDPERILSRIGNGDPLRLFERSGSRLRERHYLLDTGRLYHASLLALALAAPQYEGTPPFEEWVTCRVDQAIAALLAEDRKEQILGVVPVVENPNGPYEFLTRTFAIPEERTLTASVGFNSLPESTRRAFFTVILDGVSVDSYLDETGIQREDLRKQLRLAIDILLLGPAPEASP